MREQLRDLRVPTMGMPGYCPYWTDASHRGRTAVQSIEAQLLPAFRTTIASKRRSLIYTLDSLFALNHADMLLAGQLVRFALDADDTTSANRANSSCEADQAFCLRLRALVQLYANRTARADSLFSEARRKSREGGACGDSLIRFLTDLGRRDNTTDSTCAERNASEERLWWLSNPLWSAPVNYRRLAHEQRRIEVSLREQVHLDEWTDFSRELAPRASSLVIRYGWPSIVSLLDSGEQKSHLMVNPHDKDAAGRQLGAPQYSRDRYAVVPSAEVLTNPFSASRTSWPQGMESSRDALWSPWPAEHARLRPLLFTDAALQVSRFLRDQHLRIVVAAALTSNLSFGHSSLWRHTLVWSSHPDSISIIASTTAAVSERIRVLADAPIGPSILSLESRPSGADSAEFAVRGREGQTPSANLTGVLRDSVGLSDILLTDALNESSLTRPRLDLVSASARASSTIASSEPLGLYWETYLPAEAHTIDFEISVTGSNGLAAVRLLSSLIGRNARAADVSISWSEPFVDDPLGEHAAPGTRVIPKAVMLGMASLARGRYTITVNSTFTTKSGMRRMTTSKSIEIR